MTFREGVMAARVVYSISAKINLSRLETTMFCSSKTAAPTEKSLMAPCLQRGGTYFHPIANREAIFWVLSSGKVVPDWQQELGIYFKLYYSLQRWVQKEWMALLCTCQRCTKCTSIHAYKHTLLPSHRFVSLCALAFCCLHMPVLGVVVPSPWDDMKTSRQIQRV